MVHASSTRSISTITRHTLPQGVSGVIIGCQDLLHAQSLVAHTNSIRGKDEDLHVVISIYGNQAMKIKKGQQIGNILMLRGVTPGTDVEAFATKNA